MQEHQRQLAAILFTDIVGYTTLMQEDESNALQVVDRYHSALRINVESHHGHILNDYGDGSLCTFSSVHEALNCAMALQQDLSRPPAAPLRIGLHVGEILLQGKQGLGDGVNLASRIQSLGVANSILFSREVYDKIRNQPAFKAVSLGSFEFKNVTEPMEVFALANEGLIVPERSGISGKLKDRKGKKSGFLKKWMWNIPAILILSGAFYFIYRSLTNKGDAGSKRENSIAVLYFNNMSGDSTQEYFSDGITEEITSRLSKVSGLKVKSRTSVIQYKHETKSAKAIAQELGVKNILEGSVRKQGDKVLITVQLIDGLTDEHIWSDSYDRKLDDIFGVQSDIAQRIAEKFAIDLSTSAKKDLNARPTNNSEAYDLYLKASKETSFNTGLGGKQPNTLNAISLLRQAIKLDSTFSDAYALLGFNYGSYSFDARNPGQWLDSAEILATTAIRLSPAREKGYIAMASIKTWKRRNNESLKWLLKANEILPFSTATSIAEYYLGINDYQHAFEWINRIKENDPEAIERYFSPLSAIYYNLGMIDSLAQLIATARKEGPQFAEIDQGEMAYYWLTGREQGYLAVVKKIYGHDEKEYLLRVAQYYLFQRKWKTADSLFKQTLKSDDMDAGLAAIQSGKKELGKKYLLQAIDRRSAFLGFDDAWHLYDISRCYAAMEDMHYINYLIKAAEHGWHSYAFFQADPFFDSVRNTLRFKQLSRVIDDRNQQYKADLKRGMEASQN